MSAENAEKNIIWDADERRKRGKEHFFALFLHIICVHPRLSAFYSKSARWPGGIKVTFFIFSRNE
jgi:hypothetical protein